MATSSGVSFLRKPPTPQYRSSVFSRTTTKSMSSGPLSGQRRLDAGKQLHRPQVDVLIELKPQLQQQALFQDARRHVGMADGAQEDGVELAQLVDRAGGQHFARFADSARRRSRSWSARSGTFPAAATALRTFSPSAATSGPVPSPAITAILRLSLLTRGDSNGRPAGSQGVRAAGSSSTSSAICIMHSERAARGRPGSSRILPSAPGPVLRLPDTSCGRGGRR